MPLNRPDATDYRNTAWNRAGVIMAGLALLVAVIALLFGEGLLTDRASGDGDAFGGSLVDEGQSGEEAVVEIEDAETQEISGRFTRLPCGSIFDTQSGLEWFVGEDRDYSWYDAGVFASELDACDGGWRMAAAEELIALHQPGESAGIGFERNGERFPAQINPLFSGIGSGSWVWASGEISQDVSTAVNMFLIGIDDGASARIEMAKEDPGYPVRAFAVRRIATR